MPGDSGCVVWHAFDAASADAVLLHQLAEGAALFAGQLRGARDVALRAAQHALYVVALEQPHGLGLGVLEVRGLRFVQGRWRNWSRNRPSAQT